MRIRKSKRASWVRPCSFPVFSAFSQFFSVFSRIFFAFFLLSLAFTAIHSATDEAIHSDEETIFNAENASIPEISPDKESASHDDAIANNELSHNKDLSPEISAPSLFLSGIPFKITLSFPEEAVRKKVPFTMQVFRKGENRSIHELTGTADAAIIEKEVSLDSGSYRIAVEGLKEAGIRVIPGILSIIPPLLAIALAIIFREVIAALLGGVYLGALFIYGFNPFVAFARLIDKVFVETVADRDHAAIIIFSLLLGGMVGVISKSGGTQGIADALTRFATNARRGQLSSWLTGMIIFFDDYASCLIVGNTLRPLCDRLKISREKLSYIVDSTAAPISSIALISTWIGFEVSLIGDSFKSLGIEQDPYQFFLATIPYRFYPILALIVVVIIAATGRDFGPMLKAERRAAGGKLLRDGAVPLASFDVAALKPVKGKPPRWFNALIPVGVVIAMTLFGLWFDGLSEIAASGGPLAGKSYGEIFFASAALKNIGTIFGAANSYNILLWSSFAGAIVAIFLSRLQKILAIRESFSALTEGMKSMLMAIVILILAWSIKVVCDELHTSSYIVSNLSEAISYHFLPVIIFLVACLISFATGTSWGTMGILMPITIPLAVEVSKVNALSSDASYLLLLGTASSILAGAVFGDHCSPISDTTILSSMSSSCDHIDHVRTQIPYAVLVAVVGMLIGDIPTAFGLSPYISLIAGTAILYLIIRLLDSSVESSSQIA